MKALDPKRLPTTDEEAMQYLPQSPEEFRDTARNLYECRRAQGDSILDALYNTLKACVDKKGQ